jgi:hypothetical protein
VEVDQQGAGSVQPDLGTPLQEFAPGAICLKRYPGRYFGLELSARLTLIRLADGTLVAHSPCPIDDALAGEVEALGELRHIVAPGNFHHFYFTDWQRRFPERVGIIGAWCLRAASRAP